MKKVLTLLAASILLVLAATLAVAVNHPIAMTALGKTALEPYTRVPLAPKVTNVPKQEEEVVAQNVSAEAEPVAAEPEPAVVEPEVSAVVVPSGEVTFGQDVSSHQNIPFLWSDEAAKGSNFVYVKATEGLNYINPLYVTQYYGAKDEGLFVGSYHFAQPAQSSGAEQAMFLWNNSQQWSANQNIMPHLLDLEYNPADPNAKCYNMTHEEMQSWVSDFYNTYKELSGRSPMLYTTYQWWETCTGNAALPADMPVYIANYPQVAWIDAPTSSSDNKETESGDQHAGAYQDTSKKIKVSINDDAIVAAGQSGPMLGGRTGVDFWQYSDGGRYQGDSAVFNGSLEELANFANNSSYTPAAHPFPAASY